MTPLEKVYRRLDTERVIADEIAKSPLVADLSPWHTEGIALTNYDATGVEAIRWLAEAHEFLVGLALQLDGGTSRFPRGNFVGWRLHAGGATLHAYIAAENLQVEHSDPIGKLMDDIEAGHA